MTTMESKSRFPSSFGMAPSQPTKTQARTSTKPVSSVWNNPVWGTNGTIGNGRRNGLQDAGRTSNELADSSPLAEAVTGSGSLLPSSESDSQIVRQTPWKKNSDDMSPGLSVGNTSPLMRQKSNPSVVNAFGDADNGDAPFISLTTASGNISSRSSQKNFLDPTAGNFASGMNGSITGQSRSSRHNSDESDSYAARQTVFGSKDNGLMLHSGRPSLNNNMSGYNSSAASRSGSQPPSRGDVDYSSRQRGEARNVHYSRSGPSNPTSSSYRPNTSAVSANAPPFAIQAGSSAPGYGETLTPAQLDKLTHYFDQMNTGREDPHPSYNLPRMPFDNQVVSTNSAYGHDGQNDSWRVEENGYQTRQDQFSPTGSGTGSLGSASNHFRAPTFPQQYSDSPNSSDARLSHPSPFYSTAGTPPTYQQRGQSRGYHNGLQAGQAATLERKLRGLQQQQQGYAMPQPNPLQFRPQIPHPYDMQTQNALRMNPLQPYYPMAPAPHMLGGPQIPRGPARDHDMGHQVRSPLLEDFRNNSKTNKRYELKDIYNHIVEFSGDQHGSRFIQQKLETANSDEKDQVFRELQPNSLQLMTDVFGNYVIQKFFEHGNQAQKKMLANQMRNHVLALSMQIYGCRVVQKALEHILTDQQAQLVSELKEKVMQCVKDQNGNHVVQKAIERVPAEHIQFIINAFSGRVQDSATHPYGCRVIQRMLEYCEEPTRTRVLHELHSCASTLIVDQYGNYVTQHVIEHGKPEDRGRIIDLVTENLVNYSKHKFASNVVEKSIQFGSFEERRAMVVTLSMINEKRESPIQTLIRDQYGNYVMQKLITQLRGSEWSEFIKLIKMQISLLKQFSVGNGKQIAAVEKVLQIDPFPPPHLQTSGAFPAIDTPAAATPALTAADAQSPQSSGAPSTHAGSIDVAAASRKSSGSNNNVGILTLASTQSKDQL